MNGLGWLYQSNRSWDHRIPRGEAVLLSSGDQLRLCDKTLITFETRVPASQLLTFTQVQEQGDPDCWQVLEKAVRALRDPLQLLSNNIFPGLEQCGYDYRPQAWLWIFWPGLHGY